MSASCARSSRPPGFERFSGTGMTASNGAQTGKFLPFYERMAANSSIMQLVAKIQLSLAAGFLFLFPRLLAVGDEIVTDWSWLLGVIISTSLICLYYATHTFRAMFRSLNFRLPEGEATFPARLSYLRDRQFVLGGFSFAIMGCGVVKFLYRYDGAFWNVATLYLGTFLASFATGMLLVGIFGVLMTLARYLDGGPKVDYSNPDGCGGFLFLGAALVKFSGVTLVVGVLIWIFTLKFEWSPQLQSPQLDRLLPLVVIWFYVPLPFVLALMILLVPASLANQLLTSHKIEQEIKLALAFNKTQADLEGTVDGSRREALWREIEYLGKLRAQLHQMRSWPLNATTNISFGILFINNAVAAFESISGLIFEG